MSIKKKIKNILLAKPKGNDFIGIIGTFSFGLVMLFRSRPNTWWDKSLSNIQVYILCIFSFIIGFILIVKFSSNLYNWKLELNLKKKLILRIFLNTAIWIILFALFFSKKIWITIISGWIFFIFIFIFIIYLFHFEENFDYFLLEKKRIHKK